MQPRRRQSPPGSSVSADPTRWRARVGGTREPAPTREPPPRRRAAKARSMSQARRPCLMLALVIGRAKVLSAILTVFSACRKPDSARTASVERRCARRHYPSPRWISRGRDKRREPAQKEEPRDGGRRGLSLSEFSVPGKDAIHLAFAGSNFFNC